DDTLEIVSGHHRTRAARSAGLTNLYALVDVTRLSPSKVKAKQLAHNSIQGIDDKELVARIYADIEDVDARLEAFIDPKDLELDLPDKVSLPDIDINIDFKSVLIMFMPAQAEAF